ncbi:hypothetical protein ACFY3G_52155 [Streptomyces phaeochromogenes]|uniref:hypothetical protein n=1 Tax=Streptomyces phaeochromogenes TaxID=1923 RepID=UPI0036C01FFB
MTSTERGPQAVPPVPAQPGSQPAPATPAYRVPTVALGYQINLANSVAFYEYLGCGLLFAAPMAGVGLIRLVGEHFRFPQLACVVWVATLCMGVTTSAEWFTSWPESSRLNVALRQYVTPGAGHYLAETPDVPAYYLRDITDRTRWTSLRSIGYQDTHGTVHHGEDGYRKALADGWFDVVVLDVVVLDGVATLRMEPVVAAAVRGSGKYRALDTVPFGEDQGRYRIWVKR